MSQRPTSARHRARSRHSTLRPRGLLILAAILVGFVGLLVACAEEGQDQNGQDQEASEQPAETAPPEPEPEPETTEAPAAEGDQASDDGLSTEEWVLLGVLAVVVVAVIAGITSAASRRSATKAAASSELHAQLSEIVGTSRWIHDSGSVEILLATDPTQAQSAWMEVRRRMVDVEGQISAMAAGTTDTNLQAVLRNLGQSVGELRGAAETYVSAKLRLAGTADSDDLLRIPDQAVNDHRQRLRAAIEPVAAAVRR